MNCKRTIRIFSRAQGMRVLQLIALTIGVGLAFCSGVTAQTISWIERDAYTLGSSGYIPKLGADAWGNFVVVGQNESGKDVPMFYQTGTVPLTGALDDLSWNDANNYGIGHSPSIAVAYCACSGPIYAALMVNQGSQDSGAALFSHLAPWTSGTPGWGFTPTPGTLTWTNNQQYDNGYNPSVAIDPTDLAVVEVHQAGVDISNLWYHVGGLTGWTTGDAFTGVTWGPAYEFDYGYAPSVSVCNNVAVEVHQGDSGTLWYSVGTLSGNEIKWSSSAKYDNGYNPSVSLLCGVTSSNNAVEVHQASMPGAGKSTELWYHLSTFTALGVSWGPAVKYDSGCYPTTKMFYSPYGSGNPSTYVTEVHSEACGQAAQLNYDIGQLVTP